MHMLRLSGMIFWTRIFSFGTNPLVNIEQPLYCCIVVSLLHTLQAFFIYNLFLLFISIKTPSHSLAQRAFQKST